MNLEEIKPGVPYYYKKWNGTIVGIIWPHDVSSNDAERALIDAILEGFDAFSLSLAIRTGTNERMDDIVGNFGFLQQATVVVDHFNQSGRIYELLHSLATQNPAFVGFCLKRGFGEKPLQYI